jgi:competence protein ComEC
VALVLVAAHRPDGATRVTVLDVGQGDAILVEGGRGGRLLIDGGPDPDRLLIELDRRLPPWDRRIDVLVLTHPHEDHVAGLALLLTRYRVGRVYEGGMRGPGPGYAAWAAVLNRPGAPARATLATGDRLAVDDLRLRVLWPDPGHVPAEPPDAGRGINDVSIVLLGEIDGRRLLLTGDVEDDVDPLLASRGLPPVDFLKVAHHGSKTASTPAFLDMVRPTVAVVSAGAGNPYGHPARSTIDRLAATGARVYRTDTDGSVEVAIADGRMSVRAEGARAARAQPTPIPSPVLARFAFSCAVPSSG